VDATRLARLCLALVSSDKAAAQVQAVGLLVKARNAKLPIQSRWVAIMNRQTEIARKLASELALPPAQRSRAGMTAPRSAALPDDEWSI
jgi:phage terminase small subunit